jgi:hypothetical protein
MEPSKSLDNVRRQWNSFCEELAARLKEAGRQVFAKSPSELDRNEGLRLLLRALRYSMERDIEERDTDFPIFAQALRDTVHGIADNPDYVLETAKIDGRKRYRIRGIMGTAEKIFFDTRAPFYDPVGSGRLVGSIMDNTSTLTGTLDGSELKVGPDGRFEIIVSNERPAEGVWLPTKPETRWIHVRNMFSSHFRDRHRYAPAKLIIERTDGPRWPPPYSEQQLLEGLQDVLANIGVAVGRPEFLLRGRDQKRGNGEWYADRELFRNANPITYWQDAYWHVEPDEAMIIELDSVPSSTYWTLIFTNFWMEALDFRYHSMYINNSTAVLREDGGLRIVVAHRDPGVPNWIDVAGHTRGAMVWRWNHANPLPELPRSRIVPFNEVARLAH